MNKNTTYKRLGDYIREVNVRNTDLSVTNLLGVNLSKQFFPSIANIIGTDLSKYKVIKKRQFGCKFMSVGRDGILPISLMKDDKPAIISSAYYVFEVKDEGILLPDYLMMWIRRPEFDRQLAFYAGADVRGGVNYDDFCEMPIYIPSIERQREIVSEYETLTNRIRINEQMISKLEETAQTLYRKMFVEPVETSQCGVSTLPAGWRMVKLSDICEINTDNVSKHNRKIRYLDSSSVTNNVFDDLQILDPNVDEIPSRAKRKVKRNDIVYSTVRPNLLHYGIIKESNINDIVVSTAFAVIRSTNSMFSNELLYLILTDEKNTELLQGVAEMSKATYPSITPDQIMNIQFAMPKDFDQMSEKINDQLIKIEETTFLYKQENSKLTEMQSLLLAKMGQNK